MLQIFAVLITGAMRRYAYRYRRFIVSFFFLILFSTANASTIGKSLTLSDAIKFALTKNPSLQVYSFRDKELQGQFQTANLKPAYDLSFETANIAGSRRFKGVESAEITVSLSSVIELGGKRKARTELISQKRSYLEAQQQVASLELLGEVTRRYINVLEAQERVLLAVEALELEKITLRLVKKRVRAGQAPDAEFKRAQAAEARAQLTLMTEKQQLSYLKVALSSLWGDINPEINVVVGDLFYFGQDIPLKTLYSKIKSNPAIQVFSTQVRLKEAEVRLAKTESNSNVSWLVGVKQFQETNDTAFIAGFSVPLFSSRRNAGAISSALASRNEVKVQKDIALLNMQTQLYRAFGNRQQAISSTKKLQTEIVPALKQALKATQQSYELGRYSYLEYVGARQELLSARFSLIQSAAAALTYGAEIEQLTAEPLSASQYDHSKNSAKEF
jgi:cobalt-zinc-cadmium efflux system outer membrane protein